MLGQRWEGSEIAHFEGDSLDEQITISATLDAAKARELEKRRAGPEGAYVEIAVGDKHACGLLASGEVECWHMCSGFVAGWVPCNPDSTGQPRSAIDVDRLPDGEFVSISAGGAETCGVRPGGRVECWHTCSFLGHIGLFVDEEHDWISRDCEESFEHYSSFSPSGEFASVATNQFNGCGILISGGVACWGFPPPDTQCEVKHRSWWGEECSPGFPVRAHAVTPPAGEFTAVESFGRLSCGLRADGGVECWGYACEGVEAEWVGCDGAPTIDGRLESFSIGAKHVCGLRPGRSDNVVCWGPNQFGETAPPWKEFKKLALGTRHTCGLRPAGGVECWGRNEFGESAPPNGIRKPIWVGYGSWVKRTVVAGPGFWAGYGFSGSSFWKVEKVGKYTPPQGEFSDLALGDGFSCALLSALPPSAENNIICWGRSELGESNPPPGVYVQLTAGHRHACALQDTRGGDETRGGDRPSSAAAGRAVCWGDNYWGQSAAPPGGFTSLSAGLDHTCGLRPTGEAECWGGRDTNDPRKSYFKPLRGNENRRELRHVAPYRGSALFDSRPTPPAGGFTQLAAGAYQTCGLRPTGRVECWSNQRTDTRPALPRTITIEPLPNSGNIQNTGTQDTGPQGGIRIQWEQVSGRADYELRLNGGQPVRLDGRLYDEHTFEGLEHDKPHSVELRSVNETGTSEWSLPRLVILHPAGGEVLTPESPPKAETLTTTAAARSMTLTWTPVKTAESYEIHLTRQFFSGQQATQQATQEERHWKHTQIFTGITNTSLTINTLQPAATYRIDLWTRNAGGTNSTSLNITTPPLTTQIP